MNIIEFEKDLTILINKYSIENGSNTPDFILSRYLVNCLNDYTAAVNSREAWYGRQPVPITEPAPTESTKV